MSEFETSEEEIWHGGQKLPILRPRNATAALWTGVLVAAALGVATIIAVQRVAALMLLNGWPSEIIVIFALFNALFATFVLGVVAAYFWSSLPFVEKYLRRLTILTLALLIVVFASARRDAYLLWAMIYLPLLAPLMGLGVVNGLRWWRRFEAGST